MQEIIVDEGKIKCLISGKYRKETPEEYVRQEFCRILLDVYKYPKSHIEVEYPIKVGSTDKRCDIVVFATMTNHKIIFFGLLKQRKKMKKKALNSFEAICRLPQPYSAHGQMAMELCTITKIVLSQIVIWNFLTSLNTKKALILLVNIKRMILLDALT